jgi:hypothetical protein
MGFCLGLSARTHREFPRVRETGESQKELQKKSVNIKEEDCGFAREGRWGLFERRYAKVRERCLLFRTLKGNIPASGFVMKNDEASVLMVRGRIQANDLTGLELVFRFDHGELA